MITNSFNQTDNEIHDEGSLHHYRTEIPNLIFQLNLDPWVFKTYCVFKKTAGDKGSCYKSNKTLAQEIGCSIPKLIQLKKDLLEKGLIKILKRKHKNGGDMPDLICIVDVWGQNMKVMSNLYPTDKSTEIKIPENDNSNSNSEGKQELGGGVNAVNGGSKRRLHKEDPKEEIDDDDDIAKKNFDDSFTKEDLYYRSIVLKKDWIAAEIETAWIRYLKYRESGKNISDPIAYIDQIINGIRQDQNCSNSIKKQVRPKLIRNNENHQTQEIPVKKPAGNRSLGEFLKQQGN